MQVSELNMEYIMKCVSHDSFNNKEDMTTEGFKDGNTQ